MQSALNAATNTQNESVMEAAAGDGGGVGGHSRRGLLSLTYLTPPSLRCGHRAIPQGAGRVTGAVLPVSQSAHGPSGTGSLF